jgi:release factor glutamine methyltransferase
MKLKDLYQESVKRLKAGGFQDSQLESRLLLEYIFDLSHTEFITHIEQICEESLVHEFSKLLERRLEYEPIAYITGEQEFWSLPFKVTRDVLIPRPETELLIETILQIHKEDDSSGIKSILELGTGSGIIAIILALEMPESKIFSLDYSYAALQVARDNIRRHRLNSRINLLNSNWFTALKPAKEFDIIVSNPPYLKTVDYDSLAPDVKDYEPHLALFSGSDGMDSIKEIARKADSFLKPGGWVILEINEQNKEEVLVLFTELGRFDKINVSSDLANLPRIFSARKKGL